MEACRVMGITVLESVHTYLLGFGKKLSVYVCSPSQYILSVWTLFRESAFWGWGKLELAKFSCTCTASTFSERSLRTERGCHPFLSFTAGGKVMQGERVEKLILCLSVIWQPRRIWTPNQVFWSVWEGLCHIYEAQVGTPDTKFDLWFRQDRDLVLTRDHRFWTWGMKSCLKRCLPWPCVTPEKRWSTWSKALSC